jgi:hypothetical protein
MIFNKLNLISKKLHSTIVPYFKFQTKKDFFIRFIEVLNVIVGILIVVFGIISVTAEEHILRNPYIEEPAVVVIFSHFILKFLDHVLKEEHNKLEAATIYCLEVFLLLDILFVVFVSTCNGLLAVKEPTLLTTAITFDNCLQLFQVLCATCSVWAIPLYFLNDLYWTREERNERLKVEKEMKEPKKKRTIKVYGISGKLENELDYDVGMKIIKELKLPIIRKF